MDIQNIKALVVDDDTRFAELLKKTLESKNCEVTIVSDDLTALSCLINNHYHIVFLDCVLKDKNGMELNTRIKDILGDSVEIIMMSGIVSSKSLSAYMDLGVFDFLSKPISESEIDINLRKVRERYLYGKQDNILIKLFKEKNSSIEALKYLVLLKQASNYEFFLYLSVALSTKDSLKLRFTLNNRTQEIVLNKGSFVDYKCRDADLFIERLLSNGLIETETALSMRNKTEKECVKYLISEFILSPDQIVSFKYDLFLETLKSIHPDSKIPINFEIMPPEKETSVILTQNEYADIVFLCLKQKFNNEVFPLFDENLMKRHLIFNKDGINKTYLPEFVSIIEELQSKMKLKTLYEKHIQDKNIFCFYILYILLKGDVFISDQEELNQNYLYERYRKLENFINETDKTALFHVISGMDIYYLISTQEKKEIYNNFLKKNHPDIISKYNLSNKILNQVNQTIRAFKKVYDAETDLNVKRKLQQQKKEDDLATEVLMTENKKLMERYLVEKNYKSAGAIFETVPTEIVYKDLEWQLLAVWFYMKTERNRKKEKELLNLMSSVQKSKKELDRNKIYYYVVGLNYINRGSHSKALESFKFSKRLDYSFKPNYEEIKKCSLHNLKNAKRINPIFEKLLNLKKKAG